MKSAGKAKVINQLGYIRARYKIMSLSKKQVIIYKSYMNICPGGVINTILMEAEAPASRVAQALAPPPADIAAQTRRREGTYGEKLIFIVCR